MYVCQEIHYLSKGNYTHRKTLKVFYKLVENGSTNIEAVIPQGVEIPNHLTQCYILPDMEVSPSCFKDFEKKVKPLGSLLFKQAFNRTKQIAGGYLQSTLEQRLQNSPNRAGSFYPTSSLNNLSHQLLSANWQTHEGSPEKGKVILKTNSLVGYEGVIHHSRVKKSDIIQINPKNIQGRVEQAVRVASDEYFPETKSTFAVISFQNPQTGQINVNEPFLVTLFPGRLIGDSETLVGGKYVKLIR